MRRAALGDLANKTKTVNSGLIKLNVEKPVIENHLRNFKDVKPRVDTGRSKLDQRRTLTRSNSIKSSIPKVMVTQTSADEPKLVRTRSSTIAVKEERRIVKIVPKPSVTSKIEKKTEVKPLVRREESTLTRKNLTSAANSAKVIAGDFLPIRTKFLTITPPFISTSRLIELRRHWSSRTACYRNLLGFPPK